MRRNAARTAAWACASTDRRGGWLADDSETFETGPMARCKTRAGRAAKYPERALRSLENAERGGGGAVSSGWRAIVCTLRSKFPGSYSVRRTPPILVHYARTAASRKGGNCSRAQRSAAAWLPSALSLLAPAYLLALAATRTSPMTPCCAHTHTHTCYMHTDAMPAKPSQAWPAKAGQLTARSLPGDMADAHSFSGPFSRRRTARRRDVRSAQAHTHSRSLAAPRGTLLGKRVCQCHGEILRPPACWNKCTYGRQHNQIPSSPSGSWSTPPPPPHANAGWGSSAWPRLRWVSALHCAALRCAARFWSRPIVSIPPPAASKNPKSAGRCGGSAENCPSVRLSGLLPVCLLPPSL